MASRDSTFDAAKELLQFMLARSTGGGDVPTRPFESARNIVLADPVGKKLAPEIVRMCRQPDNVWAYIKGRTPSLDTYAERRTFLNTEFEPLLSGLERFESSPLDSLVLDESEVLDSASVTNAWRKALERRASDPEGAITVARTMLESVCKTILDDESIAYDSKDDLPKLYRKVAKALKLAPSDHADERIKRILGGATTVAEGVGSLRNAHGDAHGNGRKDSAEYRLSARHAALAVNAAGTVALLLMETFEARGA
jgi:hypothetical protein